jgi:hypothetical protein
LAEREGVLELVSRNLNEDRPFPPKTHTGLALGDRLYSIYNPFVIRPSTWPTNALAVTAFVSER